MFAEKSFTEIAKRMMLLFFVCDANRRNIFIHVGKIHVFYSADGKNVFFMREADFFCILSETFRLRSKRVTFGGRKVLILQP